MLRASPTCVLGRSHMARALGMFHSIFTFVWTSSHNIISAQAAETGVIAVLGSSVARGHGCSGNCSGTPADAINKGDGGCYQAKLKLQQQGKRIVLNSARNGDDTSRALARLPGTLEWVDDEAMLLSGVVERFVVVGLSLANEGYNGATYRTGIRDIISQCQAAGAVPIIGLCYANGWKGSAGYTLTKAVNIELQQLNNVTSINFLGGVDDGSGGWAVGHFNDAGHPNDLGQIEMFLTIVPSLFEALAMGKPQPGPRSRHHSGSDSISLNQGSGGYFFAPKDKDAIHSFTVSFEIRAQGGLKMAPTDAHTMLPVLMLSGKSTTNDGIFERQISIDRKSGSVHYEDTLADSILHGGDQDVLDGGWHTVTVTHHYARSESIVYVDGRMDAGTGFATSFAERIAPRNISLVMTSLDGELDSSQFLQCRDLLIYRAGLNSEEVNFLSREKSVLKGSLEIYAPLAGQKPHRNLAQSLSKLEQIWTAETLKKNDSSAVISPSSNMDAESPSTSSTSSSDESERVANVSTSSHHDVGSTQVDRDETTGITYFTSSVAIDIMLGLLVVAFTIGVFKLVYLRIHKRRQQQAPFTRIEMQHKTNPIYQNKSEES